MRFDLDGLLWTDPITKMGSNRVRYIPPVPQTGWRYNRDFPNLSGVKVIGFDTETKDPDLLTHGAGWATDNGHVVGVSIATKDGYTQYWPLFHEYEPEDNVENPDQVFAFLRDILENPNIAKVGANLTYDIGWMYANDKRIRTRGKLYDVQYAAALINKRGINGVSLENLAQAYLNTGKESNLLYEWSSTAYGGKATGVQRANIYRCPPQLVGLYAESDAILPLRIYVQQHNELAQLGLMDVFDMECDLIPMLIQMRLRGVAIDEEKVNIASDAVTAKMQQFQQELDELAGFHVHVYAANDIAKLCDASGISYKLTANGAPSFRKNWLANHEAYPLQLVEKIRKYHKAGSTFLENSIRNKLSEPGKRLHPTFHPLKSEAGGTGYGRYSSSNPNAQQIPSRDKEIAPLIRACFVPDDGYTHWLKMDLSQIEYRLFAHYAFVMHIEGSRAIIEAYKDPRTDFHDMVSSFLNHMLPRGPVKNINFGKLYGMQVKTFSNQLRENLDNAKIMELINSALIDLGDKEDPYFRYATHANDIYNDRFPAAKGTLDACMNIADNIGEIKTIMGRIARFDDWGPEKFKGHSAPLNINAADKEEAYRIAQARGFKGKLVRYNSHKALNHKLQGSAADILKKGMRDAYKAGVFDKLGYPHLTVHDELDLSYNEDLRPYAQELKWYIENAIKLRVPVIMDAEVGTNWGNVEEYILN